MKIKLLPLVLLLLRVSVSLFADDNLIIDPSIYSGSIDNGVTYYIKENYKPENRVELRLVVKAGSILESEKQRGLAHFVEHMAFNGTKNFPKDELIKYLESLGMGFGPEINAYTSFDETVYKLSIPADDKEAIDKGFQILEDWAHLVTLSDEEIEKERGVIVEEWRLGRGVKGRFWDRVYPALLDNSQYAKRLPIGIMDVVKNCDTDELRDYYKTWYRPDLISVVVVGDIKKEYAEKKIKKHFSFTSLSKKERVYYDVPIKDDFNIELISDPEQIYSEIFYYIKKDQKRLNTANNYKSYITEILSVIMFNQRMKEIYTKPEAPFLSASSGFGDVVLGVDLNHFYAQVKEGSIDRGLESLVTEIESVKRYGYSEGELERAKALIIMIVESYYNERENKENNQYIDDIVKLITIGNIPLDPQYDMDLINAMMPEITIDIVNSVAKKSFSGVDRTLAVHTGDSKTLPDEKSIREIFKRVENGEITKRAKEEDVPPLFELELKGGFSIEDRVIPDTDIHKLTLNNGIEVYLKKTDFKSDEILLSAISYGGYSQVEDSEYISALMSTSLRKLSGLNGLDNIEVDKALTGKNVVLNPWIGGGLEGFTGSSSVKEIETLFQLIYLNFTHPEFSSDSFDILLANYNEYLDNKDNYPDTIFSERVVELLGSSHYRVKPFTPESLKRADFETASRIYRERFGNPSDFKFVLVGSFDLDYVKELSNKYLGALPLNKEREFINDLGIRSPEKVVKESIKKGLEEKSTVQIVFNGEFTGNRGDYFLLTQLDSYLQEMLRLRIREDLGGTYGVSLYSNIELQPFKKYEFGIYFGCEPGRENELILETMDILKKLKGGEVDLEVLDGIRENYIRRRELSLKENSFWLSSVRDSILYDRNFSEIGSDLSETITKDNLLKVANEYLNFQRYVQVVLKPQ